MNIFITKVLTISPYCYDNYCHLTTFVMPESACE